MKSSKQYEGFTLIELLVVIAIIGVLSSVVLASLASARDRANNAERRSELTQIRTALELYYQDHNSYPSTGGTWRGTTPGCWSITNDGDLAIPGLVPTYIPVMPQDPRPVLGGCYMYTSNGTDYKVIAHMTVAGGNVPQTDPMARWPIQCGVIQQNTYAVYSSGGMCW